MPTVCKITLDAEQYRQELSRVVEETRAAVSSMNMGSSASTPEVPQVEDQEYAITGVVNAPEIPEVEDQEYTITGVVNAPEIPEVEDQVYTVTGNIDVPDAAGDALGDIADNAADAASEVGKAGGKIGFFTGLLNKLRGVGAGEQIGKGAAAVGAIGAAAGASVPPVGALAAVVNALLSPIALITMALTALMAIGKAVWDALTISAEEYSAQAEHASKSAEQQAAKLKEQSESAQAYLERLKELSAAEKASNTSKTETISLLQSLQREYGNLGAEIDSATGKIKNLVEVEMKLRRARAGKDADNKHQQADAKLQQARASYMKGLGDSYWWTESGAAADWDERVKKAPDAEALLADIKGVYQWAQQDGKSADTLNGLSEAIGYLEEVVKLRKQADSLQGTGFSSEEESAEAVANARRAAESAKKQWQDSFAAAKRRYQDDLYADSDNYSYKKDNRQKLLAAEQEQYKKIAQRQAELRKQRQKITSQYSAGQEYSAEHAVAVAQLDEQIANAGKDLVDSWSRQADLRKQVKELDKQHADSRDKLIGQAKYELEYSRLIAAGLFDKAAALKQERELRGQNLRLTKAEREELERAKKAQAELKLQSSLHKKATDLKYQIMEQTGRGYEAAQQRALQEARETKGRDLTAAETEMVKKLTDLTYNLNNMQGPRLGDLSIKTNALASRGGFQGSVKMPSTVQYNRLISEYTKQLLATAQKIENLCRDWGKF